MIIFGEIGTWGGFINAETGTTWEGIRLNMSSGNTENYSVTVYGLKR